MAKFFAPSPRHVPVPVSRLRIAVNVRSVTASGVRVKITDKGLIVRRNKELDEDHLLPSAQLRNG
jgi:hypothetical protein